MVTLREEVWLLDSAFDCTVELLDDEDFARSSLLTFTVEDVDEEAGLAQFDCGFVGLLRGLVGLVGSDILLWLLVCRRLTAFLSLLTKPAAALPLLEEEAGDSSMLALIADFLLLFSTAACCNKATDKHVNG